MLVFGQDFMRAPSLKSEEVFQEEVREVIRNLFAARRNATEDRNMNRGLEDVAIFFLEIIGTIVGLSWGTYVSILYALNNTNM